MEAWLGATGQKPEGLQECRGYFSCHREQNISLPGNQFTQLQSALPVGAGALPGKMVI